MITTRAFRFENIIRSTIFKNGFLSRNSLRSYSVKTPFVNATQCKTQFNNLSVPDPNVEYYVYDNFKCTGFTYLMKLVLMAETNPEVIYIIEQLIKDHNMLNAVNSINWNALMIACINSNNKVVKILIDANCNLDTRCLEGKTALMLACKFSNTTSNFETVKMLVDAGADVNIRCNPQTSFSSDSPIQGSAGNPQTSFSSDSPIQGSAGNPQTSFSSDPSGNNGLTALMYACVYSKASIVKMLIGGGCNANIRFNNGYTAMMSASIYSNTEAVRILIDANCDLNLQNNDGLTALMLASMFSNESSNIETVKTLINAGCDLNIKDKYGLTALMHSSICAGNESSIDAVKILINAGCKLHIKNNNGLTALDLVTNCSTSKSKFETIKLLSDAVCTAKY